MRALFFPNVDLLRLVLASGVLPPAVTSTPARAGVDSQGRVWIEPPCLPPREVLAGLARLGVQVYALARPLGDTVNSWAELLPLRPLPRAATSGLVLFDLPDTLLARFAATVRRHTAAPCGIRVLADDAPGRAWLTCPDPPPSLLLRSQEPDPPVEPFTEQLPGVWVRLGWEHPLPQQLVTPPGQLLLLRPPRSVVVRSAPLPAPVFGEYPLARYPCFSSAPAGAPAVPLRLALRPVADTPREVVWVFPGTAGDRFWEFCATANERLLRQFEVATAAAGEAARVVVRPAPGLRIPPFLPLAADGYYADPRVPGLFVPTRRAVHPVVRPRELARLLDTTPARLTWIETGPGGEIVPRMVPVSAFRPVPDLLDYVAPSPVRLAVEAGPSDPFAFGRFNVVSARDEQPERQQDYEPPRRRPPPAPAAAPPADDRPGWFARSLERLLAKFRRHREGQPTTAEDRTAEKKAKRKPVGSPAPARVQKKLSSPDTLLHGQDRAAHRHDLEARLLAEFPRLGPDARAAGWADLAAVYAATGNPGDAAVCWVNAIWEADPPPVSWVEQWLVAECRVARQSAPVPSLDRWLSESGRFGAGRVIAAYAVWGACQSPPPGDLVTALPRVLGFLDQHFDELPARAAWLARRALTDLCAGDTLGLARWRDRVLARLRDKGPGLDLDVPSFLRFHGTATPDRFRTARDWLARARKPILDWVGKLGSAGRLQWAGIDPETNATAAYAQLMLAWGLGYLGDWTRSRDWAARARKLLGRAAGPGHDPAVPGLLADAFHRRIRDVQEGRPPKPGLPPDLLARFDELPTFSRYAVDRLRDHSRILEPAGRTQAFRGLDLRGFRGSDLLGERLQLLADHSNPAHLADEARQLLAVCTTSPSSATVPRIALTLLDLAPYLDAAVVGPLLGEVVPAAAWLEAWLRAGRWTEAERADRLPRYLARLLGGAFAAAAGFNLLPAVRPAVDYLLRRAGADPALRTAVVRAAGSLFRSLRKLGYRTEAEALLHLLDPGRGTWPAEGVFPPARLGLAVGWFAAGDEEAGIRILDDAQRRLFVTRAGDDRDRTELAIAYADALGFAPPRIALGRLEEIFQRLDRVTVTGSTNRYYTLKPLQLIDTVVRAVVTEEFSLGPAVRGWLDDDEFLIRRRIHRDMAGVLRGDGIG